LPLTALDLSLRNWWSNTSYSFKYI